MIDERHSPSPADAPAEPTSAASAIEKPSGYWRIVWRQFRKNRLGLAGLFVLLFLALVALLAPLLANEVPIVARFKGSYYFPAFPTYLDAFPVPTPWVDGLRKIRIGDRNSFSEHYPVLEGKSWKKAIGTDFQAERGDWYVPPLVFFSYKESTRFKLPPGETDTWGSAPEHTSTHWLGTDGQGRDVLARLIHGTIISLSVGVVAVSIYALIGLVLGALAGYFGGWIDVVLSRFTEIVICFPSFFLIITVIAFLPRSIYNIMVVIGLTSWPGIFRLVRGEVLKVKEMEYCVSARALGASWIRIVARHVVPNSIAPVFVTATFGVASAILIENALSFLGFGVAPPTASWGEIVSQGRSYVGEGLYYLVFAPGLAIFVTVTAFNLVGQALRDAMDPRLRQ